MGLAPLDFPILLGPRPSWPILICPHAPTGGETHRHHTGHIGRAWASLPEPSPNPLSCSVLFCAGGYGVLLLLASLGLALPHLEGGCWADASLRRGSDRSWTALSQLGPQSFLPVAWPTSVLPKRSEWIWQIYYLSHLYLLPSRLSTPVKRPVAPFLCLFVVVSNLDPRSSDHLASPCLRLLASPVSSRPVPSSPVRTGRSISRHSSP